MEIVLRSPRSQLKSHKALVVMVIWDPRKYEQDPNFWRWRNGVIEWCPTNDELKRINEAMKKAEG